MQNIGLQAVRVACEEAMLSERRACGLLRMHRGSGRYQRRDPHDAGLRVRLRELAVERVRFGYRRLWAMVRRKKNPDGTRRWVMNHKRVHRIYREEGLVVRRKTAAGRSAGAAGAADTAQPDLDHGLY